MPRNSNPAAILAIILISYFMILLDNSVIFTGLPSIRAGLDLSPTGLSWVQDAYTLVFGGLLLLGARAGDIVGRRRLFLIGLAVFGTASLLIGLAPAGWWMIAARALQGIGAAIVAPTSLALITAYFKGEARSRAVAWYAATAGIGASLGPLVGGALTDWISWRAAFLVNVPIAVAMIIGARAVLAETPRQQGRSDVVGALCATMGMGALVFGIIESGVTGWGSARVVVALIVGLTLLAALVVTESRVAQPIMPLRLFRSRERSGAYATRMLYLGAMIGFFFFTTQYLQDALGFTPLQAGLGFLPMSLCPGRCPGTSAGRAAGLANSGSRSVGAEPCWATCSSVFRSATLEDGPSPRLRQAGRVRSWVAESQGCSSTLMARRSSMAR
jgi:MFS family permease